jgi:hypothetical protein
MTNRNNILNRIAREHLRIQTLETRRSGSLDFYEVSVWVVESALAAAFEAGRQSINQAKNQAQPSNIKKGKKQ